MFPGTFLGPVGTAPSPGTFLAHGPLIGPCHHCCALPRAAKVAGPYQMLMRQEFSWGDFNGPFEAL